MVTDLGCTTLAESAGSLAYSTAPREVKQGRNVSWVLSLFLYPARLPPCEQSLDEMGLECLECLGDSYHVFSTGPTVIEEGLCLFSVGPLPALSRPGPLSSHVPATAHKVVMTGFQSPLSRGSSQLPTWDGVTL